MLSKLKWSLRYACLESTMIINVLAEYVFNVYYPIQLHVYLENTAIYFLCVHILNAALSSVS